MDNDVLNFTYFSKIYFEDIFINSYLYFYRDKLYAFAIFGQVSSGFACS